MSYSSGMTNESEAHVYEVNDTATVRRGQYRNEKVTILTAADAKGDYAVKTEKGVIAVIKGENLKAPAEGTVTASELAQEIQTMVMDMAADDTADLEHVNRLVSRLEAKIPGLGARISWPVADRPVIDRV